VENDYTREIDELQLQVDALVEAEGDAREIAELGMELQVLRAIYERTAQLYQSGRDDLELRHSLAVKGYGEWTLDNVYAFVFETTTDLPSDEHRSFLGEIRETDYAALLH
jgi:hypothetical protein